MCVVQVNFSYANGVAHVKWGASRGGYVRDVYFDQLTASGPLEKGILVDGHYSDANPSCPAGWAPPQATTVSNLSFRRISATSTTSISNASIKLAGHESLIVGARFEDIQLPVGRSGAWECDNVTGTAVKGSVHPWPPCAMVMPISI